MPLPGPRSHRVSLADAAALTKRRSGATKGGFFFRKELDEILAQAGCAGIRYYHAQKADGTETIVLVGVDGDGNDMTQGVIMEDHFDCPPHCGAANALNS